MKTTWRFLKRHGRRLVVVGIAGVVFVFLIGFFGRLVGQVARSTWTVSDYVEPVTISSDGSSLVTLSMSDPEFPYASIWNTANGTELRRFTDQGVHRMYRDFCLSPTGRYLALTLIRDGSNGEKQGTFTQVHDLNARTRSQDIHIQDDLDLDLRYEFSPNSDLLAIADSKNQQVRLWDVAAECQRFHVWPAAEHVQFSPDGRCFVTSKEWHPGSAVLWDVATGKQLAFIPAERAPGLISFSRDSRQLVVITQLNDDELGKGMLRVARWNVATQQVVHQEVVGPGVLLWPESLRGRALYVHKQSDGRRLLRDLVEDLTVCRLPSEGPDANDVEIRGWVVGPRGGEVSLTYPDAGGSQLAPTPADPSWLQRLASAIFPINAPTQDAVGRIRFCDVQTGKNLGSMPLAHILFAEDGKSVVLAHSDKTISIWDVPPRRPIPLILLLAFLHTALILAPCWYFARRR